MEVGVRELKQRLSWYLEQVDAGTEVVVTDRGRPKARIVPIIDDGHLQRGIDEGWIRPAVRSELVGGRPRLRSDRRSGAVLDEDRA